MIQFEIEEIEGIEGIEGIEEEGDDPPRCVRWILGQPPRKRAEALGLCEGVWGLAHSSGEEMHKMQSLRASLLREFEERRCSVLWMRHLSEIKMAQLIRFCITPSDTNLLNLAVSCLLWRRSALTDALTLPVCSHDPERAPPVATRANARGQDAVQKLRQGGRPRLAIRLKAFPRIHARLIQAVWRWTGLVTLFFLCGLEAIPRWQFEVARIEGVGPWMRMRSILFPGVRHLAVFAAVFLVVDGFAAFSGAYNLLGGSGGILDSGLLLVTYVYQVAFPGGSGRFDFPGAAAMSLLVAPVTAFLLFMLLQARKTFFPR